MPLATSIAYGDVDALALPLAPVEVRSGMPESTPAKLSPRYAPATPPIKPVVVNALVRSAVSP
ncbi:hypothetical protein D3C81_2049060 [compost metagenome]